MPLTLQEHPDLPAFRVMPANRDVQVADLRLPDNTPMSGPDAFLAPAARQFSTILNSGTRVYSYRFDEAMRDSQVGARAMRRDAFLTGLFEERILPTINREWQLEVDDPENPKQRQVRDGLTAVVKAIPDFDAFKRANLDGVWFGRAGCQWAYTRRRELNGKWGISRWDPIHGDSMQFTFDGIPAILLDAQTTAWYTQHGATVGPDGDIRSTDRGGMALVLQRPYWRDRFSVHVHMRQKADFFEGELAGSVQGTGLRGMVYWQYVVRTDALTWMLGYMQAVGQMDLLIFNYPWNDAAAKLQQENNASKIIGKAAIACPRDPKGNWPAVEQVPMNAAGLKALQGLLTDYFDRHIERLFVGQSMSAGADKGTGLGGTGRAEFAKATKDEILVYDTGRLDATFTSDLVAPLLRYNYPWADFPVRFKSIMPDVQAKEKVESGKMMVSVGIPIKVDEFREAARYSRPKPGDEVIATPVPGAPPVLTTMGQNGPDVPALMGGQPTMMPGAPIPGSTVGGAVPGIMPGSVPPGIGMPQIAGPAPRPGAPAPAAQGPPTQNAAQGPHGFPNHVYGGNAGLPRATNNDGGGGVPPTTGPVMGAPGGSNTYLPRFDPRRRPIGTTRYARPTAPLDHTPFHNKIAENPRERTSSLVYADFLEENGMPALAAFVRRAAAGDVTSVMHYPHRPLTDNAAPDVNSVYNYQGLGAFRERVGRRRPTPTTRVDVRSPYSDETGGFLSFNLDLPQAEAREVTKQLIAEGHPAGNAARDSQLSALVAAYAPKPAPPAAPEQLSRYQAGPHEFCSTQVNLSGYANILLSGMARAIRPDDLHEKGIEDECHVTVRYGLHAGVTVADVARVLKTAAPPRLMLGKVSVFPGVETGKDYDVLKVDVASPDLEKLNAALGCLPNTQTFAYHPHATIAYLKAGRGADYAKVLAPLNLGIVADSVVFSDTGGMKTTIDLAPGKPPVPEIGATYHPNPIKQPTRYSTADLHTLLKQVRQDPYNEQIHGIVADALDDAHPGHPVAELIRQQFGHGPYGGQGRKDNLWYEPVENSWDGTFPYTAHLGAHGPFDIRLGHESPTGHDSHAGAFAEHDVQDPSNSRWVVHAVSRLPGSRDTGYTFEFPHEDAHLIPALFPGAKDIIDPHRGPRRTNRPAFPGARATMPREWTELEWREDEARRFDEGMDQLERGDA